MAGTKGIMMAFAFVLVAFHFTSSETLTNGKLHVKTTFNTKTTFKIMSKIEKNTKNYNFSKWHSCPLIYHILLLVLASKIILKGVFLGSPFI